MINIHYVHYILTVMEQSLLVKLLTKALDYMYFKH